MSNAEPATATRKTGNFRRLIRNMREQAERDAQFERMEAALRQIAEHGSGPLGGVVNVTKLSDALAAIARDALPTEEQ